MVECSDEVTHNEMHWRSTGIDAMSAECQCQLKKRNFDFNPKTNCKMVKLRLKIGSELMLGITVSARIAPMQC